ncbi:MULTISPECIES: hypothetical protein [Mycolicibacterium]|uniref:hypothetical protein n=1 Tax=Mycolicibacterium TaxID=1866885 RepID=UPI001F1E03C2|nr:MULTISPECIES: hypothetical protein [Mycolicibacterium]
MTTPPPGTPPGDNPGDSPQDVPPQDIPPAYQYSTPPPNYQPPPPSYPPNYPPPPPGYPYGAPPPPQSRISIGMVFIGPILYATINLILGFMAFLAAGSYDSQGGNPNIVLAAAAVVLAVIAFGGGIVLLRQSSRYAKGLGIGLMIGWALVSLFTAGFCTGVNPQLYTI